MLISIICPVYNSSRHITDAVLSVVNQTNGNWELILVDDGSTDGTGEEVSRHFPDVVYIYQRNSGVSSARNKGMAVANGKFVAFLDSDDVWYQGRLEILNELIEKLPDSVGLVFNDMDMLIGDSGNGQSFSDDYFGTTRKAVLRDMKNSISFSYMHDLVQVRYGSIFYSLLRGNVIQPSCTLLRREIFFQIGGFREDFRVANDSEYFLRIAKSFDIAYLPSILTTIDPPDNLISLSKPANSIEKIKNTIDVIKGHFDSEADISKKKPVARRLAQLYALLSYHYLSDFQRRDAIFYCIESLKWNWHRMGSHGLLWAALSPNFFIFSLGCFKRFARKIWSGSKTCLK